MFKTNKIKSPVLAINSVIAAQNIKMMKNKTSSQCIFRPHFKTHDNKLTASIYRECGITKITVSSLEMATYFRKIGFRDITIALPVNIREHKKLRHLSGNTNLGLLISNSESAKMLLNLTGVKCNVWIEIDTGYARSGIIWNDYQQINESIEKISGSTNISFTGFLTHNGSTYSLNDKQSILKSSADSILKMMHLKDKYAEFQPLISIGDTPGCSLMNDFSEIDEVRPGNFVYYNLMMLTKGVCTPEQIAATVFCPIIDINPERLEIVIHGGAIHFSKEYIEIKGIKTFGKVIHHYGKESSKVDENLVSLSQEHGIVKILKSDIKLYRIGDLLEIIPVHSCLTANLMKNKTLHYEK